MYHRIQVQFTKYESSTRTCPDNIFIQGSEVRASPTLQVLKIIQNLKKTENYFASSGPDHGIPEVWFHDST